MKLLFPNPFHPKLITSSKYTKVTGMILYKEVMHGATARFCMIYVEFIEVYHHFSRAIMTGNFKLYIHALNNKFFSYLIIGILRGGVLGNVFVLGR
jgi:hypothetical protein